MKFGITTTNIVCHGACVMRCWRKADILPPAMTSEIVNEVGSRKTVKEKCVIDNISKDIESLVTAMSQLCNQPRDFKVTPAALENSYADRFDIESGLRQDEMPTVEAMSAWINAEDNPDVLELEVASEFEKIGESTDEEEPVLEEANEQLPSISHADGDYHLRHLLAYTQGNNFPDYVQDKAESLFADIKKHRSGLGKRSRQQLLATYFSKGAHDSNMSSST